MHYFRVHPDQWRQRLETLAAMGADTVETYVAWNVHEARRGTFNFSGIADLGRFLDIAAEVGLSAIVRPGPYICAEWDNGGFPAWLTGTPGIHVRTNDPSYLAEVDRWFDVLIPVIASRQTSRGGNVTMVQVENEYGSYGSDKPYLVYLRDGLIARGIDVELFTSDGGEDHMLTGGMIPGVRATVNFGSRPEAAFAALAKYRPGDAPFCMEYWNGWFDHWGEDHHVREGDDAADVLEAMLAAGASVNFYMAHGGTNFGVGAGANHDGVYQPTVTSYDYDAPIDERGEPTAKYQAFREVIARYRDLPAQRAAGSAPLLQAQTVALTQQVPLVELMATGQSGAGAVSNSFPGHGDTPAAGAPPTFEELGISHGLVRYSTTIPGPRQAYPLTLPGLRDRAHIYADGELIGIAERDGEFSHPLAVPGESLRLDIVVESMGRVNYGTRVGETKGLTGGVLHERQYLNTWSVSALELPDLPENDWQRAGRSGEVDFSRGGHLLRGEFEAETSGDSYVLLDGFGKGYVWVNGFCLGRYWKRGPQRSLYLPAPVVRAGSNEILVLELDEMAEAQIALVPEPVLG